MLRTFLKFRRWRNLTLAAGILWCGFFSTLEVVRTFRIYRSQPWTDQQPQWWRMGAEPVERLSGFLATADGILPDDSLVVFSTSLTPPENRFYVHMWTAYLLPRHQILPVSDETFALADYWIRYGAAPQPARGELAFDSPSGALYKLP